MGKWGLGIRKAPHQNNIFNMRFQLVLKGYAGVPARISSASLR